MKDMYKFDAWMKEYLLGLETTQKELIDLIEKLNKDKSVNAILLQSPIPSNLDINEAFTTILSEKDVDGFNPVNVGKLVLNQDPELQEEDSLPLLIHAYD